MQWNCTCPIQLYPASSITVIPCYPNRWTGQTVIQSASGRGARMTEVGNDAGNGASRSRRISETVALLQQALDRMDELGDLDVLGARLQG
jgi:hypothetical protein